jgi:hypothetical protein
MSSAGTCPQVQLAMTVLSRASRELPNDAQRAAEGDEAGVAHVKTL